MHLIYKQFHLYINLYIKKQHVFLLRNDNLYSIYSLDLLIIVFLKALSRVYTDLYINR